MLMVEGAGLFPTGTFVFVFPGHGSESCDCMAAKHSRAGRKGQCKVWMHERSAVCSDMFHF